MTGHIMDGCFFVFFVLNESKITTGKGFLCVCVFSLVGLPADDVTAMVVKECRLFIYCVRLSMVPQLRRATCSRRCMHK